jgi:hypothetical protein
MSAVKHLIVTASDARCGDFLVEHWHRSLSENVRLEGIDVVVLDYGLRDDQRERILGSGMQVRPCVADGHVTNTRYRDAAALMGERAYDQVLMVDSGDVIFQDDIRHLFDEGAPCIRAACDERKYSLHAVLPILSDFIPEKREEISRFLHDRPQINGGFVLGPAAAFVRLWDAFQALTQSLAQFAADQVLLNYVLHQEGFEELPSRYNFVLVAAHSHFSVREGRFYDAGGTLIPVVHNAGYSPFFRRIARFGYGPEHNVVKTWSHVVVRCLFSSVDAWSRFWGCVR